MVATSSAISHAVCFFRAANSTAMKRNEGVEENEETSSVLSEACSAIKKPPTRGRNRRQNARHKCSSIIALPGLLIDWRYHFRHLSLPPVFKDLYLLRSHYPISVVYRNFSSLDSTLYFLGIVYQATDSNIRIMLTNCGFFFWSLKEVDASPIYALSDYLFNHSLCCIRFCSISNRMSYTFHLTVLFHLIG